MTELKSVVNQFVAGVILGFGLIASAAIVRVLFHWEYFK